LAKKQFYDRLIPYLSTEPVVLFRELLIELQTELRAKNDTATLDEVTKNQGALRLIKEVLSKTSITEERRREYNGGFDE